MESSKEKIDLESSALTNPNAPQSKPEAELAKPSLIWSMICGTGRFTRWLVTTFCQGLISGVKFTIIFDFMFFYGIKAMFAKKQSLPSE